LKPVKYRGFASTIKSEDQYPTFFGAEQTTEVAEQASFIQHTHTQLLFNWW